MLYSIYKNISSEEFAVVKKNLDQIEQLVTPFLQTNGFFLNRDSHFQEFLGLDYMLSDNKYMGNIGVKFIDKKYDDKKPKFNFYIVKAHDIDNVRYSKVEALPELCTIDEIANNSINLFQSCIIIYRQISDDTMVSNY